MLTGTPGAGKTAIIRQLEVDGFGVVEEAATDVIALQQARGICDPWKHPWFLDAIADLQRRRQLRASHQADEVQFHDRSVICTAALATYLGHGRSAALTRELERVINEEIYERSVFFLRNLGFISPSDARRISFVEAVRFETIHKDTYRDFGFEIMFIEPGSVLDRVAAIKAALQTLETTRR